MIKLLFDHQKFSTQYFGGISRYFSNVIDEIKHREDFDSDLGVLYSNNYYLNGGKGGIKKSSNNPFNSFFDKRIYQLNSAYSGYLLKRDNFDIFHPTYYDPYFIHKTKKPIVITIHDMTYERLPEYFWADDPLTNHKRLNIERADKIIAISETTKNDLIEILGVNPTRIDVVYHGIDIENELIFKEVNHLPENYLLYVGDRSGYKNLYFFLNAYAVIQKRFPEVKLIMTGGGALAVAELEFLNRLNLMDHVKQINATDEELNYLYKNAIAFVYPSLYEGFGLPILEAFKAECPVLLSNITCFKEVGGDAVSFFDPLDPEELISKLEMIITDIDYRMALVEKGKKRLNRFSIKESLSQTLDVYKSLV
jgi:glycosyltransferase involved in cell wall biosynthesis